MEALCPCGLPARMGDSEPLWSLVAVRAARPHGRLRAFVEALRAARPHGPCGLPARIAFVEALWPCGLPARMGDSEPLWKPCGRPLWKPCGRAGCPPAWATQSLCGSRVAVRAARPHGRLRAFVEAVWPCGLPARMGDSEPLWKPCGRAGCPPAWATQSLCGSRVAVRAARPHGRLRAFVEAVWPCGLPARMGDSEPLWKPCGRAG